MCCLALGALPALSQPGGGRVAPFGVYTHFESEPAKLVLDSLKQELTAIMARVGLSFQWRSLDAPRRAEVFTELAVITFKGKCDLSELVPQHMEAGALGWTHVTDGHVLPFSDVDCSRIRGFLSRALIPMPPQDRDEAFGFAVARVLAHELFHIFTQTDHHGSAGLTKAAYTVPELMAGDFQFEEADLRTLEALMVTKGLHDSRGGPPLPGQSLFAGSGCTRCHGPQGEGTSQGPSLRDGSRSFDAQQLAARLKGRESEMYRRARDRKRLWPSLTEGDVASLVTYLNEAVE